ncbi:MAG TPA: amidohydrolase family protein [Pyrinomonadaceae bacterium]|nr:amidohydrolase family protein [Pyrinomonadaceae bacterium]
MRKRLRIVAAISLLAALSLPVIHATRAQQSAIDTYAITNARIVTVSGQTIERGTVVIRNGLITGVGSNAIAPADARIIDGTGLTVYPGLIDSNTTLGIPLQSQTPAQRPAAGPAAQPQSVAVTSPNSTQPPGLQPEIITADLIQPGGDQIEAARSAGITTALTAPREGIFIGQSVLINLAGDTPQQMIVRSPVALHIGFTPLRTGGYPASLMGVFAALRQMFLDAQRYREAQTIYQRNPRGLRRPEQDKSLAALLPVLAREMPVVMYANAEREIIRALDLTKEFNLRTIIAGGAEGWKVADRLREQSVPVLLSLNFPKRMTASSPDADPDPLRVLRERVDAPKAAGRLAAAGVRFAFQSDGMTTMTDFLANAVKAVENGLARDEALRALTIRPAEILGVADRLGTIEAGKIANLTITRGDLFDRNMRISHVFIDGRPVDLKPVTPAVAGQPATASGTWTLNVNLGQGRDFSVTLTLQQQEERLSGTIQGDFGSAQIANASIGTAGDIQFTVPVTVIGQATEATFTGRITGNEMRGTVQVVGRDPGSFTGTRPGPSPLTRPSPARPSSTPPTITDLSGTWALNVTVGQQQVNATLTIRQQGSRLTGTFQSQFGTSELSNGSVGADGFRFTTTADVEGRTVEIILAGTASEREMRGTLTSEIGTTSFTGTRPKQ